MIRATLIYTGIIFPEVRFEDWVNLYNIRLNQAILMFQVYNHFPSSWLFDVQWQRVHVSTDCFDTLTMLRDRFSDMESALLWNVIYGKMPLTEVTLVCECRRHSRKSYANYRLYRAKESKLKNIFGLLEKEGAIIHHDESEYTITCVCHISFTRVVRIIDIIREKKYPKSKRIVYKWKTWPKPKDH